jgi:phosphocarrier protein FPr/phosphocarrier protein
MHGWSAPLDEVPDAVFAGRLLGDGVAIDPTEGVLCAPCDGVVITVPAQKHAITLRAACGAEILLHVGIDTVALNGEGFELHVSQGSTVKAGDRLLTFDLDVLARRATSLLTPVIVTDGAPFSIVRRSSGQSVRQGEFLMELAPVGVTVEGEAARLPASEAQRVSASPGQKDVVARVIVPLEHGIHARPAAMLASRVKTLAATVTVSVRDKSANARSAIALMSLGVRKGEEVTLRGTGPDAATAVAALEAAIRTAKEEPEHAPAGASLATPKSSMRLSTRSETPATTNAPTAPQDLRAAAPGVIAAVTASPGIATGIAFHLARQEIAVTEAGRGAEHESSQLETARARVRAALQAASASAHSTSHDIITAHLELLDDPELAASASEWIARGKSAGYAWRASLRAYADVLSALPDARMNERVDDLRDLEHQVLSALQGDAASAKFALPNNAIVLAHELLPSQFVALDRSRLAGVCTAGGGPTSHVAVLAAAFDVPMLVAAGPAVLGIPAGTALVLDADHGKLHATPAASELTAATQLVEQRRARRAADREAAHLDCRTADGTRIEVFANVGSAAEAEAAVAQGAEGCGLLRTEFLFLDRDSAPDEATQTEQYQRIVSAFTDGPTRPVVIRTLDAGADKPLAYLRMPPEENPALGVRGIRVSLQNPALLRTQLRAILRIQPRGACRILLPMVSEPAEVRAVRAMLEEVRRESVHDGTVLLGAMIETPASALLADQIAREADFLSIGTNDLTQYTLAMDRGNPALAARLDALHPAVLRLIATAARAGRAAGKDVAVCGGLASDPVAAPILIGLGVNELSAVPSVVPRLKAIIRALRIDACEALACRALATDTAAEVRSLATAHIAESATPNANAGRTPAPAGTSPLAAKPVS